MTVGRDGWPPAARRSGGRQRQNPAYRPARPSPSRPARRSCCELVACLVANGRWRSTVGVVRRPSHALTPWRRPDLAAATQVQRSPWPSCPHSRPFPRRCPTQGGAAGVKGGRRPSCAARCEAPLRQATPPGQCARREWPWTNPPDQRGDGSAGHCSLSSGNLENLPSWAGRGRAHGSRRGQRVIQYTTQTVRGRNDSR